MMLTEKILSDLADLGLVTTDDVSWYLSKPYYLYTDEKKIPTIIGR